MRHFFSTLFIVLALVVSAGNIVPVAHAQECPAGQLYSSNTGQCVNPANDTPTGATPTGLTTSCPAGQVEGVGNQAGQCFDAGGNATGAAPTDPSAAKTATDGKLGPTQPTDYQFNSVMAYIVQLFAWLFGVAAITLDNAVYYTVVKMGGYVNNLSAVGVTWRIMRDVGNIMLIFGFLAAGIMTILNTEHWGFGRKMLPMLLVAAVFLNFSLFISEAVIDTGNLFATQFYTQINGGDQAGAKTLGLSSINQEGISNAIMSNLGLQTIYGQALNPEKAKTFFDNSWTIGFMSILLFLIAAFVMFSLAFILIARFVILLFLIIVAPIGFAGLAIPKLSTLANKWWGNLFDQTITAPVLLLLLYIALAIITDVQFLTGFSNCVAGSTATGGCQSADYLGFVGGNLSGFAGVILGFLVAMGLLLAVVIASKKMSAFSASWATKTAGAASFGLTAWAGRNSIGWGANKFGKYLRTTRFARVPLVGTGVVKGFEKVAGSNFDVRGVKRFGGLKAAGVDAGDAHKGGYKDDLKKRVESRTKYAEDLKGRELTDNEKTRQALLQKEVSDYEKELKEKRMQQARDRAQGRRPDPELANRIAGLDLALRNAQRDLDELESVTDKGAKRKYASNLELGYLGLTDKSFFNKYVNFAANTEATKKIREEAKKSKDDKTLDDLKKALKKIGGEEEGGGGEKKEEKKEEEQKSETPK